MQWTMERIIAEMAHVDAQMVSYLERCHLENTEAKEQVKKIKRFVKSHNEIVAQMLRDIADSFPQINEEILREQAGEPSQARDENGWPNIRYRPSEN